MLQTMSLRRLVTPLAQFLCCSIAFAAETRTHRPTFEATADLVLINATVLDRHYRPVRGLTRDDFRLFENKAEQTIAFFAEEETPLSLAVVFDASGSMQSKIAAGRTALRDILRAPNDTDEFALISFSQQPEVTVDWTRDDSAILNRLFDTQARGRTSLFDAVHLALDILKRAHNHRAAMLILSDGGENNSRFSERTIARMLEEAGVQIYAVDMSPSQPPRERSAEEIDGPGLLARLCGRAGGRFFQVSPGNLAKTAEQIRAELRSQYLLGYRPAAGQAGGKFRKVDLKVSRPPRTPTLHVYWRRGYRIPGAR